MELQPNHPRVLQSYASLLYQEGDLKDANDCYIFALKDNPNDVSLIRSYAYFQNIFMRDHKKSEEYILKGLSLSPDEPYLLVNVIILILFINISI